MKGLYTHRSMFGTYEIEVEVLNETFEYQYYIEYIDPWSKEEIKKYVSKDEITPVV